MSDRTQDKRTFDDGWTEAAASELSDPIADLRSDSPEVRLIAAVWDKGASIPRVNQNVERLDSLGNRILYLEYANRDSDFGWEMHHVVPAAEGGPDDLSNLEPLYWKDNVRLGNLAALGVKRRKRDGRKTR